MPKSLNKNEQQIAEDLGLEIKNRRIKANMSQKVLGQHLGVSFQQIQKYECGLNRLPVIYLIKLIELFKCTYVDLIKDNNDY